MKIEWIEAARIRGGLSGKDRELVNKLADEIYRLSELKNEVKENDVNEVLQQENIKLKEHCISLVVENDKLRSQLNEANKEPEQLEEEQPKKRGRPKKLDVN